MSKWTISRSPAKGLKGWHIQARTDDQFNSFACVATKDAHILRAKSGGGDMDVFTLTQLDPHVTFNVLGKITYTGDWNTEIT